ncbi:unnamed protein product, partial [Rotaria sp. Silwood1]
TRSNQLKRCKRFFNAFKRLSGRLLSAWAIVERTRQKRFPDSACRSFTPDVCLYYNGCCRVRDPINGCATNAFNGDGCIFARDCCHIDKKTVSYNVEDVSVLVHQILFCFRA